KPTQPELPSKPNKPSKDQHKYTICHATRSATNPYRVITVDYNSIVKMGHGSHDDRAVTSYTEARTVKSAGGHWGDIIPAMPEHDYPGKNNDQAGRKLLANNCNFRTEAPAADVEDRVETPTPGRGAVIEVEEIPQVEEVLDQPTVEALPVTGMISSPLLILMLGVLTAGASYLVSYLRSPATE